MHKWF